MKLVCMLVLGMALAAPVAVAAAETGPVPAPDWHVGSSWEYSDGYAMRVSGAENGLTTFERLDAPGQWFSMRGFLRQDAQSGTSSRQTIYRTVKPGLGEALDATQPLTYQREYLSNGELMVHASSWTVEGRERITVPAGTFDCWVIVWRSRSLKSDWTAFERWWYAPEAQSYVRIEYKYGHMTTESRVLMRYSLIEKRGAPAAAESQKTASAAQ